MVGSAKKQQETCNLPISLDTNQTVRSNEEIILSPLTVSLLTSIKKRVAVEINIHPML